MIGSRSVVRIIGALLLTLLAGCSALRLGYGQVPDLVYWWIDGYFDVSEAQQPRLRDELTRLHQWHRREELPRYAGLLQRVQQLATADVSTEQVCQVWDEVRGLSDRLAARALAPAAELALTLSAAQLSHAQRKFDKVNEDFMREHQRGSHAERHERRFKTAVERAETWYGRLDERQLGVLRGTIDNSGFDPRLSLQERRRRQQDVLATLRKLAAESATPAQSRAALNGLLQRSWESPEPRQRAYAERSRLEACANIALMHNHTSAEQRARLLKTLKGYEADLRALSGA